MSKGLKKLTRELREALRKEKRKKRKARAIEHMEYMQDNSGTGFHRSKKKYTRKVKHKDESL